MSLAERAVERLEGRSVLSRPVEQAVLPSKALNARPKIFWRSTAIAVFGLAMAVSTIFVWLSADRRLQRLDIELALVSQRLSVEIGELRAKLSARAMEVSNVERLERQLDRFDGALGALSHRISEEMADLRSGPRSGETGSPGAAVRLPLGSAALMATLPGSVPSPLLPSDLPAVLRPH